MSASEPPESSPSRVGATRERRRRFVTPLVARAATRLARILRSFLSWESKVLSRNVYLGVRGSAARVPTSPAPPFPSASLARMKSPAEKSAPSAMRWYAMSLSSYPNAMPTSTLSYGVTAEQSACALSAATFFAAAAAVRRRAIKHRREPRIRLHVVALAHLHANLVALRASTHHLRRPRVFDGLRVGAQPSGPQLRHGDVAFAREQRGEFARRLRRRLHRVGDDGSSIGAVRTRGPGFRVGRDGALEVFEVREDPRADDG